MEKMKGFFIWVARNKIINFIIWLVVGIGVGFLLSYNLEERFYYPFAVPIAFSLFGLALNLTAFSLAMSGAIKTLNTQCNPFPLLEVTQRLLGVKANDGNRLVVIINHCVGLVDTGQYEKCIQVLQSVNVDAMEVPLMHKVIYYHNLANYYFSVNDVEGFRECYQKSLVVLEGVRNEGQRKSLRLPLLTLGAEDAILASRYAEAEKLLIGILSDQKGCLRQKVSVNYLLAEVYVNTGREEMARECLNYVIANGNKLIAVPEAKFKLEKLDKNPN